MQKDSLKSRSDVTALRAEGAQADVRSALHSPDDPPFFVFLTFSCIYVCYVGLCVLWVLVGPAKLHCGATPPSLMAFYVFTAAGKSGNPPRRKES